jgi:hypothetical protein
MNRFIGRPGSFINSSFFCYPTIIYLSRKPILFKSFTGLLVKQFDDIFKVIESKYSKYEIKRLFSLKRDRSIIGAGRRFKLAVKDRVIMVLVYYMLYITYTLMEFLFGLDQSNACREI